jgi:hypothetical protein
VELAGDTSTAIVFNYLDAPAFHVHAEAASNNHFDEDGLLGIFALLAPGEAMARRALIIDAAQHLRTGAPAWDPYRQPRTAR